MCDRFDKLKAKFDALMQEKQRLESANDLLHASLESFRHESDLDILSESASSGDDSATYIYNGDE